ncbi:MAG: hypothetical protein IIA87_00185 [Nanoarchaeota archaeon]|nr:hypothetical protein [Nanoarchaeota archaeon]
MQKIKNNKKGIAEVIGVVFIILISIVSAGILYSSINTVTEQLSPAFSCTDIKIQHPTTIEKACYNKETNELEVTIERTITSNIEINSIGFVTSSDTNSLEFLCGFSCGGNCVIPDAGETKTYYFDVEGLTNPKTLIISINDCTLESKEILPACL